MAKQLSDRIQLCTSQVSDEYTELPTLPGQTLVNQRYEFPPPVQATLSFQ